ncbi:uncharacterized protein LOC124806616 [Hydra vulgaris]|uniref:uncharacterized protein LOC124806616 n=1 Tax=Hydra vulgaris TaxID=6087 RepID=UPI0032E9D025
MEDFLFVSGEVRTLGSFKENNLAWIAAEKKDLKLKDFNNCKNFLLLVGNDLTRILDICSIPELHIFTGCVNIISNELAHSWGTNEWTPFLKKHGLLKSKVSWMGI